MNNEPSLSSYDDDLISDDGIVDETGLFPEDFDDNPQDGDELDGFSLLGFPEHDDTDVPETGTPDDTTPDEDNIGPSDVIDQLLRAKGITDPAAVNFENDQGELEQVDFYSLPYDEQLAILSNETPIEAQLAPEEIDALSFLRENNVTLEEAIEYYQRKAVEDHINSQAISGMEVDQYSDEELYMMDLRLKFEDFSDEEIEISLQKELEHPELFRRKIEKLRTDYKEVEDAQLNQARYEQEQVEAERSQRLEDTLISTAMSISDIGGLDLDNDDKNQILHYILEKDMNGTTAFVKSLNSPQQLFELAWFATKGKEAFNILHDYYKKEIETTRRTAFEKGKATVSGTSTSNKTAEPKKNYVRKNTPSAQSFVQTKKDNYSIDDLPID